MYNHYLFAYSKLNKYENYIKELQRRLDQTLGKPGSYLTNVDRVGNLKPMTVGARLYRVEQQLSVLDKKMDQMMHAINGISHNSKVILPSTIPQQPNQQQYQQQHHLLQQQQNPLMLPPAPSLSSSPCPSHCLEDDV